MKIEHVAIWTQNLEQMKNFYVKYFNGTSNDLYHNSKKNFTSYFISFKEGSRLELMHRPDVAGLLIASKEHLGLTHLAISVGSKDKVDKLTKNLRADGYSIIGEPRTTGDGYYESVVSDPEGNRVEITI
ncbi:MAG: VOC family protein [Bacteroidota bacterium]